MVHFAVCVKKERRYF